MRPLVAFAMLLQEATNMLFMRKFSVSVGMLKDAKTPAVILRVDRVFGKSEGLVMDMHSFMLTAKELYDNYESGKAKFESTGFVISKKDRMDRDFIVPHWAFPKATMEILSIAEEVLSATKAVRSMTEKLVEALRAAGIPEEELAKLKNPVSDEQKDKPTVH